MTMSPASTSFTLKAIALIVLCLQNSALILSMRYSRSVLQEQYLDSIVVLMMEMTKFFISLLVIYKDGETTRHVLTLLRNSFFLSLPGCLYVIQNSLQLIAISHLDASLFAILSQLKIFTTAIFSTVLLHTKISTRKWTALTLLVIGVILVQYTPPKQDERTQDMKTRNNSQLEQLSLTEDENDSSPQHHHSIDLMLHTQAQSRLIGLLSVFIMTCLSGLAGIILEKYLKNYDQQNNKDNDSFSLLSPTAHNSSTTNSHEPTFSSTSPSSSSSSTPSSSLFSSCFYTLFFYCSKLFHSLNLHYIRLFDFMTNFLSTPSVVLGHPPSSSDSPDEVPLVKPLTLWERNLQLSFWGIFFSSCTVIGKDFSFIQTHGLFFGSSWMMIFIIILAAAGGLLVAVVVKYTNTIIKGFATSVSIILTSLLSTVIFNIQLPLLFWVGVLFVILSIFNFHDDSHIFTLLRDLKATLTLRHFTQSLHTSQGHHTATSNRV